MQHLHRTFLVGLVAAIGGGGVGYSLGGGGAASSSELPERVDVAQLGAVSGDVRMLLQLVRDMKGEIGRSAAHPVAAEQPERWLVAEEVTSPDAAQGLIDRLENLLQRYSAAEGSSMVEALRIARLQKPDPDLVALGELRRRLVTESGVEAPSVVREWLLLGMDEIVRRLGVPSRIHDREESVMWVYWIDANTPVDVTFKDGVVIAVN